ncbi:MAG: maleylacetate reductase [Aestuariivita sp.]|nr:maleylacetate reductase [Aestuariivita sp.]
MQRTVNTKNLQRIRFGAGIRHELGTELSKLGGTRALLLSTPQQSDIAMDLATGLNGQIAGIYSRAAMHTPVEVTEDALAHLLDVDANCLIAVGGGSTTGLSKALALRKNLPQVVIPTTYAGSEATPILGQTEKGVKTTLIESRVLPDVVLYDPELVVSLPVELTVTSGLNAMAHAAEALYAHNRSEATTKQALRGLQAFIKSLPRVVECPDDLVAREETQRGAYDCGVVLGTVGMALHHKLCHTLGGSFDLPHAQTHAILLPHTIQFNAVEVPKLLAPLAELFGSNQPGPALWEFGRQLGAPLKLRHFGLAESDLDAATELALAKPYWNPRAVTAEGIRGLLHDAWSGTKPRNY